MNDDAPRQPPGSPAHERPDGAYEPCRVDVTFEGGEAATGAAGNSPVHLLLG